MIIQQLENVQALFSDYTELRIQENRHNRITLLNGDIVANAVSANRGVSARVFRNGAWGLASNPDISTEGIKTVIATASHNAAFLDQRNKKQDQTLPSGSGRTENDFSTKRPRATQKEVIDFAKRIDAHIAQKYPKISYRNVVIDSLDMEKHLYTSEGALARTMIPRCMLVVLLGTDANQQKTDLHEVYGGFGQYEDIDWSEDKLFAGIATQAERLFAKAEGVFPRGGVSECVLDADLAGILAHEAIGHTTEADGVLGGSVAGNMLNQQVASPLITLVDFASHALNKMCPVPVFVDDEGVEATDAVIIKDGVLTSFMHNKQTAAHFGVAPTGNARAYTFSDEPLVRMRNTVILPGHDKLADMIASVEDGYYLVKSGNGQADSTSEFMFGVTVGYEIKNGKIGRALRDTTISGIAFDVLKSATMVSDDMSWSSGGMCGKKQPIPVGMGGPAIKCQLNIGGRS